MSSYHCICVLILTATRSLLVAAYNVLSVNISPHTTTCVRMPLHMCPHATTYVSSVCVLIPLYPITSCPHTTVYVSSCLLYMCPHTTIYVCPPLRYRSQLAFCSPLFTCAFTRQSQGSVWLSPPVLSLLALLVLCLLALLFICASSRRALYGTLLRHSVYLLYWYKSTNTDDCWQQFLSFCLPFY
jgi:hypothetical protein